MLISLSDFNFSCNIGFGNSSSSTSSKSITLSLTYFLYNFLTILLRLLIDLHTFFLLFEHTVFTSLEDLHELKESFNASSSLSDLKKLKLGKDNKEIVDFLSLPLFFSFTFFSFSSRYLLYCASKEDINSLKSLFFFLVISVLIKSYKKLYIVLLLNFFFLELNFE